MQRAFRRTIILALLVLVSLTGQAYSQTPINVAGFKQPAGGGGPTDFVTDTFTDTDTTTLASHTGELGATWTKHPSYTANITIQTNRAHKDTDSATAAYYTSGVPANAAYTVEGVLMDLTSTTRTSMICGWMSTTTNSMVCVRRASSTSVELIKIIAGAVTTGLASTTVTYTQDQLRTFAITRSGNDFTAKLEGVSFGTVSITDTEVSGAGRVGIRQTGAWPADSTYPISSIRAYQ